MKFVLSERGKIEKASLRFASPLQDFRESTGRSTLAEFERVVDPTAMTKLCPLIVPIETLYPINLIIVLADN